MNIQTQLKLRSQDTTLLFKIKIGGENHLLAQAMKKIAFLYKQSAQHNIYAFLKIMSIKRDLETVVAVISAQNKYFLRKISKKYTVFSNVIFPIQKIEQLETGTPLHFEVVNMVQILDETICTLRLAKNSGLLQPQNMFFKKRNELRKMTFSLITKLACIKIKDFPAITFEDYFAKSEAYQSVSKIYGQIDPTLLYLALQSPITANLSAKELNQWSENLKKMK